MKKFTSIHRFRRSSRRRRRCTVKPGNTDRMSSQGHFEKLPAEVFDLILDRLSVVEASVFCMVSKSISNCMVRHLSTATWRNRMILQKLHCTPIKAQHLNTVLNHFRSLGLLFKRCTLLLPTKERLKFIYNTFSQNQEKWQKQVETQPNKALSIPCFMIERCDALPLCQGFSYSGVFLQTLIAGWDDLECHRVFDFLCKTTHLQTKIKEVVTKKPGTCHRLEQEVRFFCRGVMLDQWTTRRDSLFWITCILRPWPIINQARLLFILFGPLQSDGNLGWQDVQDGAVVHDALSDLSKAIFLLCGNTEFKNWSIDTIISIINEIIVMPQPWHMENVARLLMLCGNKICFSVLASKAINHKIQEISRLLVFLILVSDKDGYCMNWVVKTIQQVWKVFSVSLEKRTFIATMENMFSEVTMELFELIMAGQQNRGQDTAVRSLNSLLIANARFHTEIVCIFLKSEQARKRTD